MQRVIHYLSLVPKGNELTCAIKDTLDQIAHIFGEIEEAKPLATCIYTECSKGDFRSLYGIFRNNRIITADLIKIYKVAPEEVKADLSVLLEHPLFSPRYFLGSKSLVQTQL
jgi:hypothetical protein